MTTAARTDQASKRILVVGGGGREHALCEHFARFAHAVMCAPGNAGIARTIECAPCDLSPTDIVKTAQRHRADLVVVGPEQPLVDGAVDALEAAGFTAFGPRLNAAQLEGDKAFMKAVCAQAQVPTADFITVTQSIDAEGFLSTLSDGEPVVVKAAGLAAGKGVTVCADKAEALSELKSFLGESENAPRFGEASRRVVVERFLPGREISVLAVCNGQDAVCLPIARDHKTLRDDGEGPNTGGMGAIAPVNEPGPGGVNLSTAVLRRVVQPVLRCMAERGAPFRGLLYAGLMVRDDGDFSVLEFNVRFGDPEAQVILFGLDSDLVPLLLAAAQGEALPRGELAFTPTCAVVSASPGYPEQAQVGAPIVAPADPEAGTKIFYAGVRADPDAPERLLTSGGRVLAATARGRTLAEAHERSYLVNQSVSFGGRQFRTDIGRSVLAP